MSTFVNEYKGVVQLGMKIETLDDLEPLRIPYQQGTLKLNLSEIGRTLNLNRRTVKAYLLRESVISESTKKARNKASELDQYYNFLVALLNDNNKSFLYMKHLYEYMKVAKGITVSYGAFTHYIRKHPELAQYMHDDPIGRVHVRLDTLPGAEAQIDWKENVPLVLNTGDEIKVNILVLIFSYSRYRIAKMTTDKSQPVLFHLLNEIFEELGGVPQTIKCDNMKTIMDVAKTDFSEGTINIKFAQFALDYGFEIVPCKSFNPQLKGHVEQPNRIYERLRAYNGDYSLLQFNRLVKDITTDENTRYHKSYNMNPILEFPKDKKALISLPNEEIRANYKLSVSQRIVSNTSLVTHKNHKYSVPPEYIGKQVLVRQVESLIHIYSTTDDRCEIAVHQELVGTGKEYTYLPEHYNALKQLKFSETNTRIETTTNSTLNALDKVFGGSNEQ